MKRIVIISNYFHFAQEKASNRYRELAELLSAEPDIEVEVITSSFYQRTYQHRTNCEELVKDIPYKAHFAYEPGYKKHKPETHNFTDGFCKERYALFESTAKARPYLSGFSHS